MKRMIQRLLGLTLVMLMIFPGVMAEHASPTVLKTLPSWTIALTSHGGTIYVLTGDGLYQSADGGWMPLDPDLTTALDMDADEEALYLLDETYDDEGTGYRILRMAFQDQGTLSQPTELCAVKWDIPTDAWVTFCGFAARNGEAFLLIRDVMNDWDNCMLYRVDLTDGTGEKILSGPFTELTPYRDGLLLSRRYNESEALQPDGTYLPPEVVTIDPVSGAVAAIGVMDGRNDGALAYDAETDSVYFCSSSSVFRVMGAAPERVGRLLPSIAARDYQHATVCQGRYYIDDELDGVISASIDPSLMATRVLRVDPYDGIEAQLRDFAKLHPEIAIEYVLDVPREADKLLESMKTVEADLYSRRLDSDFIHLRDRKYIVDLSSSDALVSTVAGMMPNLTRELLVDGQLFALPVGLETTMPGYNPEAFEEAGIPLEKVPTSYEELLDFLLLWRDEYLPDHENIAFFDYAPDLYTSLIEDVIDAQILTCVAEDVPVTFDTPILRALLRRLVDLKSAIYEVSPTTENWYSGEPALFTHHHDSRPRAYGGDRTVALRLSLDRQTPPVIHAHLPIMYVNPYSANTDAAIALLEYLAQHLDISTATALIVDRNDPIEGIGYAVFLPEAQEQVALAELALAQATDADRIDLEEALQLAQDYLAFVESERIVMTSEEIAQYKQEIAPYYTCMTADFAAVNNSEQISHLRQRLVDGQLGADEFIQQMENILQMMQMEQR